MEIVRNASPYSGNLQDLDDRLKALYQKSHMVIQKVTKDIEERFHFNTAISAVMELVNTMYQVDDVKNLPNGPEVMRFSMESAVLLIAPVVPHIAEEIWQRMGNEPPVLDAEWPSYSEDALISDDMLIVVQVNGKLRGKFTISTDASDDVIKEAALSNPNALKFIQDKPVKKVIVVKRKLVNIVV
jgi:leucyl-tRNA synthetase